MHEMGNRWLINILLIRVTYQVWVDPVCPLLKEVIKKALTCPSVVIREVNRLLFWLQILHFISKLPVQKRLTYSEMTDRETEVEKQAKTKQEMKSNKGQLHDRNNAGSIQTVNGSSIALVRSRDGQ